ncbi:hypothetical protein BJ944DRAFT_259417 [Cunninghamella echinulata]|nr:hypothetical protein BJ944DRAFT_259417 [Cunninghamella echinulata]
MSVSTIDFEDDKQSISSAPDLASSKLYGSADIRISNKSDFLHFPEFQLEPLPFSLDSLNDHYQQRQQQQQFNITINHEQRTFALYLEPEENTSLSHSFLEFQDRLFTRFGLNATHSSAPHIALIPNIEIQRGNSNNNKKWETVDLVKDYIRQIMKDYQSSLIPPSFNGYHIQSSSSFNGNNNKSINPSFLGNKKKNSSPIQQDRSVSLCLKMDAKYEKLCHVLEQKIKQSSSDNILSTSTSTNSSPLDRILLAYYPHRQNNSSNNGNGNGNGQPSRMALKKIRDMARNTIDIHDWVKNGIEWKITLYEVMLKSTKMVGIKEQLKKVESWSISPSSKSKSFNLPVMLRINLNLMSSWFRVSPMALESTKRIQAAAASNNNNSNNNEKTNFREQLVC